jgi:hypothetical protein
VTDPDLRDPHLDRAYRETPRDEPPPELDERIRAAARRAAGTRPQSLERQATDAQRRSWASRWRVPLSVAATLVIAATLTVMVQDEERRPRDDSGRAVSPRIVAPREAEPPAPPAESARDAGVVRELRSAPAPAAPAPAAPAPTRPAPESVAPATAPPAAAPLPAPKLEERARSVDQPAAADSVEPIRQPEMRWQAPQPPASPPLAAPAPPAAPAAIPEPRPALKAVPQTAPAGAASESLRRDRNLGDRPERASREAAPSANRTPEAWVEQIRNLRQQRREAEATAELAELRRAYPDFQLPADLGGPRPSQ